MRNIPDFLKLFIDTTNLNKSNFKKAATIAYFITVILLMVIGYMISKF